MIGQPNEGYFGSYAMFLTETLPTTLRTGDLPTALHWATAFIRASSPIGHDFQRKSLADAILVLSWKQFERPDLTQPFVEHVFSRIPDSGELFRGTDIRRQEAFLAEIKSDVTKRRAFLLAANTRKFGKIEAFWLMRARLLRTTDFDWLLSISPSGASPVKNLDEQTLCNMINLFSTGTMPHNLSHYLQLRTNGNLSDYATLACLTAFPSIPMR